MCLWNLIHQLIICNVLFQTQWRHTVHGLQPCHPCSRQLCCHRLWYTMFYSDVVCCVKKQFYFLNLFTIFMSPPMKWGDILFLAPLFVRLSVRHTFMSALYLLNLWWDLQITLHKCQVWWDDVQCLCLTKVGSRSRSQSKIKHWLYFVSARYLLNPWLDLQITLHKCQEWWDDVQCLFLTNVCSRSRSQFKI